MTTIRTARRRRLTAAALSCAAVLLLGGCSDERPGAAAAMPAYAEAIARMQQHPELGITVLADGSEMAGAPASFSGF